MSLNDTPSGERVHIAFFGRRNAGKSSLVNAFTGQALTIVSDVKGTTTDPVSKAMELLPVGPVQIIDTPGIDDEGALGALRVERTKQVLRKTDLAILVADATVPLGPAEADGKGHVTGTRRHIHKHIVHIAPDDIGPELLHRAGDDGASPDHRVGLVLGEEIEAHELHAPLADGGVDAQLAAGSVLMDAKGGGDAGAGDVGVQHRHLSAPLGHGGGQGAGDGGLAHAPLAADDGDDLAHTGKPVDGLPQIHGGGALPAALAAGRAVMGTF